MTMMLSAYGTSYNSKSTIVPFVENLFNTFSGIEMELVIVDNYSTDGTWELLKELQGKYNINLYRKKCSKSLGWKIAFSKTEGTYTLKRDVDEIYLDHTMRNILKKHQELLSSNSIINFELSRKEVIETAGNWREDLNGGDDEEFMARMVDTGIRRLGIPAQLKIDVNVARGHNKGLTVLNEYRYAKGIDYIKRMSENLVNTIRGYGLEFSDLKYYYGYQKLALLYGIMAVKIKNKEIYRHFDEQNNLQAAQNAIEYLDPSIFSIPKERWVSTISPHVDKRIIESKIQSLKNFGYRYVYSSTNNITVSYFPQKKLEKTLMKVL